MIFAGLKNSRSSDRKYAIECREAADSFATDGREVLIFGSAAFAGRSSGAHRPSRCASCRRLAHVGDKCTPIMHGVLGP